MPNSFGMTNVQMARYLRRISLTKTAPGLQALSREIERRFPLDEATPRLVKVIAIKVKRLVQMN